MEARWLRNLTFMPFPEARPSPQGKIETRVIDGKAVSAEAGPSETSRVRGQVMSLSLRSEPR